MGIEIRSADVEAIYAEGLIAELDVELLGRYPGEPVNGIDPQEFRAASGYFVMAFVDSAVAGCGAFRPTDLSTIEIKRMYVRGSFRGCGVGRAILRALEAEARARGFVECILETAVRMPEAIALYARCGYEVTEPYGQYIGSGRSVCMHRTL